MDGPQQGRGCRSLSSKCQTFSLVCVSALDYVLSPHIPSVGTSREQLLPCTSICAGAIYKVQSVLGPRTRRHRSWPVASPLLCDLRCEPTMFPTIWGSIAESGRSHTVAVVGSHNGKTSGRHFAHCTPGGGGWSAAAKTAAGSQPSGVGHSARHAYHPRKLLRPMTASQAAAPRGCSTQQRPLGMVIPRAPPRHGCSTIKRHSRTGRCACSWGQLCSCSTWRASVPSRERSRCTSWLRRRRTPRCDPPAHH